MLRATVDMHAAQGRLRNGREGKDGPWNQLGKAEGQTERVKWTLGSIISKRGQIFGAADLNSIPGTPQSPMSSLRVIREYKSQAPQGVAPKQTQTLNNVLKDYVQDQHHR